MKYKIMSIDTNGQTQFHNDSKVKTLLEDYGYISAKPIYRDTKKGVQKVGYVLTHRGYNPIWIELVELKNFFDKGVKNEMCNL